MFKAKQYRDRAKEYGELRKTALGPNETLEFSDLEKSFTTLADNEEWLSDNHTKTVQTPAVDVPGAPALEQQEEHLLRCLGAALIMQWNELPSNIRRQLFDSAGTMGDAVDVTSLRERIARFLNEHQDTAPPARKAM
jgi:hypothetical protein